MTNDAYRADVSKRQILEVFEHDIESSYLLSSAEHERVFKLHKLFSSRPEQFHLLGVRGRLLPWSHYRNDPLIVVCVKPGNTHEEWAIDRWFDYVPKNDSFLNSALPGVHKYIVSADELASGLPVKLRMKAAFHNFDYEGPPIHQVLTSMPNIYVDAYTIAAQELSYFYDVCHFKSVSAMTGALDVIKKTLVPWWLHIVRKMVRNKNKYNVASFTGVLGDTTGVSCSVCGTRVSQRCRLQFTPMSPSPWPRISKNDKCEVTRLLDMLRKQNPLLTICDLTGMPRAVRAAADKPLFEVHMEL